MLHYTGTDPEEPARVIASANASGPEGTCFTDTPDAPTYALSVEQAGQSPHLVGGVATRLRTHEPDPGIDEVLEFVHHELGGDAAGLAVIERTPDDEAIEKVEGRFGHTIDWAGVLLEILPR